MRILSQFIKFGTLTAIVLTAGFYIKQANTSGDSGAASLLPPPAYEQKFSGPVVTDVNRPGESKSPVTSDSSVSFYRNEFTPAPEISAVSALVADMESEQVYLGVKQNNRWPMASIVKLMTAVIVLENLEKNALIAISPQDVLVGDGRFENIIRPGDIFTVEDLLKALLISSSNEASEALAGELGREVFISKMNAKSNVWGLSQTHFKDPSGISASNQSSSADLLSMASKIYAEKPEVFSTTRSSRATITEINSGEKRAIQSSHLLTSRPDFLGGKTGTTPEAGANLITLIGYGRPLVIIVLGTEDRFGDTEKLLEWFKNDFSPSY